MKMNERFCAQSREEKGSGEHDEGSPPPFSGMERKYWDQLKCWGRKMFRLKMRGSWSFGVFDWRAATGEWSIRAGVDWKLTIWKWTIKFGDLSTVQQLCKSEYARIKEIQEWWGELIKFRWKLFETVDMKGIKFSNRRIETLRSIVSLKPWA